MYLGVRMTCEFDEGKKIEARLSAGKLSHLLRTDRLSEVQN